MPRRVAGRSSVNGKGKEEAAWGAVVRPALSCASGSVGGETDGERVRGGRELARSRGQQGRTTGEQGRGITDGNGLEGGEGGVGVPG